MPGMRDSARRLPAPVPSARRRALLGLAALLGAPLACAARVREVADLAERLPRALAACGLPLANLALHVSEADAVRPAAAPIATLNAEQPFVLASTAKLVTSLAALDLLGANWRWRTLAFATGPVHRQRLLGDLMIVGGGDPSLSVEELRRWLSGVHAAGLHEIGGDLIVDHSAFHLLPQDHAGTPEPAPDRPHHAWPDALALVARAAPARAASPRRAVSLTASMAADPAAQALLAAWEAVGGRLRGRVRPREAVESEDGRPRLPIVGRDGMPLPPLATHPSPPLAEVLQIINKTSHNLAARHLMLALAPGFPVRAATLGAARERVRQWLARQGLGPGDVMLDNGSGLSRAERARPRALVQLLQRAWGGRQAQVFVESLPVAGVDGTLMHRLRGGAAMGQAFLKTGTLLDARALAGYVRGVSGRPYAVALFAHHPDAARARPAMDAVIERLARHG